MGRGAKPSTFILNIELSGPDEEVLKALEFVGLEIDREYGVVKLDPEGKQGVVRVNGTEAQVKRAQTEGSLRFTFYPDLAVFRPKKES
jgi:hypothetical protein